MSDKSWTEEFFYQWIRPDWITAVHGDGQPFRPFVPSKGKWELGKPMATKLRTSQDQIQVLWLLVQDHGTYIGVYAAKIVGI